MHRRLGDLYAERARLQQIEEIKKGCSNLQCSTTKQDRTAAITHYEQALKQLQGDSRSEVLTQKAYLHDSLEQRDQALKIYALIIAEGTRKHQAHFVGHAHMGRGEIFYRKVQFKQAVSEYNKALAMPETRRRGQIYYRLAWCELNLGNLKTAQNDLIKILTTPSLLNGDTSFHEDVARDLASFYARGPVGPKEIESLRRLSPQGKQEDTLRFLAEETDRLGNKRASLYVWGLIKFDDSSPFGRAEKKMQMARLHYEMGQKDVAAKELKEASLVWNEQKCSTEDSEKCQNIKKQMRDFIVNWNKGEKVAPDKNLLSAYLSYLAIFPTDYEMHHWAGQLARDLKNYVTAAQCFKNAAIHATDNPKILRGALLNQIEVSEQSGDPNLRLQAYLDYLQYNPKGEDAYKVKYQIAHAKYEQKKYQESADEFYTLAVISQPKGEGRTIQIQSADLALDAQAILKNDEKLEQWGKEFASLIPEKRQDYLSISRKASLNLMAANLNDSSSSTSRAIDKAKNFSLVGASHEDKVAYFKNLIVLGEKAQNIPLVREGAQNLLKESRNPSDIDLAQSRLVWTYEMELNFNQALKIAERARFPELSADQRILKLAVLSELSGRSAKPYYEAFLQKSRDQKQMAGIRQKLIRNSRNPWAELAAQKRYLTKFPEVYAESLFETYARQPNDAKAAQELQNRKVLGTPGGQNLARVMDFKALEKLNTAMIRHRLNRGSESALARTLSERVQMLKAAENYLVKATQLQDWSRQVFALTLVERENARLAREIHSFPVPKGLSAKKKQEYLVQLNNEAQQFEQTAQNAKSKMDEFWSDSKAIDNMENAFINSEAPYKTIVRSELVTLQKIASESRKDKIARIIRTSPEIPSASRLAEVREKVQKNPFNTRYLSQFKEMQEQLGHTEMAAYLNARIDKLNSNNQGWKL